MQNGDQLCPIFIWIRRTEIEAANHPQRSVPRPFATGRAQVGFDTMAGGMQATRRIIIAAWARLSVLVPMDTFAAKG